MDWNILKAEYIAGGTSYRELAEKYEVSESTLRKLGAREKWTELRNKVSTEAEQKLVDTVSDQKSGFATDLCSAAEELLAKIREKIKTDKMTNSQSIKHYSSALKDLRDLMGIKTEDEKREIEARIKRLERDAQKAESDGETEIEVVFAAGPEEWNE